MTEKHLHRLWSVVTLAFSATSRPPVADNSEIHRVATNTNICGRELDLEAALFS